MPKPTSEQKFTIGLYVGVLSLVIVLIWGFFLKYELRAVGTGKTGSNLSAIGGKYRDFLSQTKQGFQETQKLINDFFKQGQGVTASMSQSLADKAEEKIKEKGLAEWQIWSGQFFTIKYPADWYLASWDNNNRLILSASDQVKDLNFYLGQSAMPTSSVLMELRIIDNEKRLTAQEWLKKNGASNAAGACRTSTTTATTLGGQMGVRIDITDCPEAADYRWEVYAPLGKKMINIAVNGQGEQGTASRETAETVLQSLSFKKE